MADAMYAWTRIFSGGEVGSVVDALGRERKVIESRNVIEPGDSVSADDVGGEETFDQLVEAGSLRPYKYPEDVPPDEPVVDYLRRSIRERAEEQISEEEHLLAQAGLGLGASEEELMEAAAGEAPKAAPAAKPAAGAQSK